MGTVRVLKEAEGTAPAANYGVIYMDTADNKIKFKDDRGVVSILSSTNLRSANYIDNGGMMIQQKIAVASTAIAGITTTTRAGVVADRWAVTTSVASNLNWQQVDTSAAAEAGLSARYYGSIISTNAGKKVMLSQWLINRDIANLRGKKVRLTVNIKQKVGSAQTYKLGLLQLTAAGTIDVSPAFLTGAWSTTTGVDPAWGTNLSPITPQSTGMRNGTISGNFLAITTSAAWQKCSVVFTLPADFKNLVPVIFSDATGGTTDNISLSEISLTIGEDEQDWEEESFDQQLQKCQQFYNKTFAYGTVPVQNAGAATGSCQNDIVIAGAVALACTIQWRFPVKMWRTPVTVTSYSPAAATVEVFNITGAVAHTATTLIAQLDESVTYTSTGNAAGTVGQRGGLHITASAEIVN